MSTKRIEALTDGVFAIAMTLLVLNFKVPVLPLDSRLLLRGLIEMIPKFVNFAISFFILASLWTGHHRQDHLIKKANNEILWLNSAELLFVIIIPFSTSLYGEYGQLQIAALFLEINILLISFMSLWQWFYATRNQRLVDADLDPHAIAVGTTINLVVPAVTFVTIAVSFFSPENSTIPFIFIPLVMSRLRRRA